MKTDQAQSGPKAHSACAQANLISSYIRLTRADLEYLSTDAVQPSAPEVLHGQEPLCPTRLPATLSEMRFEK